MSSKRLGKQPQYLSTGVLMLIRHDKGHPVRKVIHRGTRRRTGRFASRKMKQCVPWESSIERDFIQLLEYDRDVEEYYAQPMWVTYTLDGKLRRSCPDFLAHYTDGRKVVWEVKPVAETEESEFLSRFDVVGRILLREGYDYSWITDTEIRSGNRLTNIIALFRYLHWDVTPRERQLLLKIFGKHPNVTMGDLFDGRYGKPIPRPAVYALIAQGDLDLDIEGALAADALLEMMAAFTMLKRWPS